MMQRGEQDGESSAYQSGREGEAEGEDQRHAPAIARRSLKLPSPERRGPGTLVARDRNLSTHRVRGGHRETRPRTNTQKTTMHTYLLASVASLLIGEGVSFQHKQRIAQQRRPSDSSRLFETSTAVENNDTSVSTRAMELKRELIALSESTNRGFRASRVDR